MDTWGVSKYEKLNSQKGQRHSCPKDEIKTWTKDRKLRGVYMKKHQGRGPGSLPSIVNQKQNCLQMTAQWPKSTLRRYRAREEGIPLHDGGNRRLQDETLTEI